MRFAVPSRAALVVVATLAASLAACGGGPQSVGPQPVTTLTPATTPSPASSVATVAPTATASASPAGTTAPTVAPTSPIVTPTTGNGGTTGTSAPATAAPATTPMPVMTTPATLTPQGTPLPAGEKIYVVNHAPPQGNVTASNAQIPSVTVYPVAATGAATPLATLIGPSTGLDQAQFITVDKNNTVYVTNQGTSLAGSLTVYPNGQLNGNVAPAVTVTGLYQPEGVCVDDAHGYVFVVEYFAVDVYRLYANGAVALDHQIKGNAPGSSDPFANAPQLFGDYGCFVNDGYVFIAGSEQWLGFKTTDTGNVAPTFNYGGPASLLFSDLSVFADTTGDVFLTNLNTQQVSEFMAPATTATPAPGATAAAVTDMPPTVTSTGTAYSEPFGSAIDIAGQVFVTNIGNNSVDVFSSTTTLLTGVPTATISGTGTGLNRPYGVYAR